MAQGLRYSPVWTKRAGSQSLHRLEASGWDGFPRFSPSSPFGSWGEMYDAIRIPKENHSNFMKLTRWMYSSHTFGPMSRPFIPYPWLSLGNRTYKVGLAPHLATPH